MCLTSKNNSYLYHTPTMPHKWCMIPYTVHKILKAIFIKKTTVPFLIHMIENHKSPCKIKTPQSCRVSLSHLLTAWDFILCPELSTLWINDYKHFLSDEYTEGNGTFFSSVFLRMKVVEQPQTNFPVNMF